MGVVFNTVLVPVDFSTNTDIAVKKALWLTGNEKAIIHLLHITSGSGSLTAWNAVKRLEYLACRIREEYTGVQVKTHVHKGYLVQRGIIGLAKELTPDLIIIGKKDEATWWRTLWGVSPRTVARKTNCPVLTIKAGSTNDRVKVIVIPISDGIAERKLEWGIMLAQKYKAQIHLLALMEGKGEGEMPGVFLRAYHYLRDSLRLPIEFATSKLHHPAKAAMKYAKMVKADLILVNPETESWIGGLRRCRHISDLFGKDSGIQVLEVSR